MWKIKNTNPETTGSKKSPSETNQSHLEPKPAKTVDLVFKVWAPNLNRVSDRLFLLGSIKQLGAWNIHNAAHAFPTADQHTWKVEVRNIPMHSNFEWAWLKARHNKTDIKWESKNKRTRKVESFGGVIHTIFGDEEEVFIKSATYVEVSTYRKVEDGQYLVLTGCAQSAGNWDLDKALKATEQPKSSGYWKCQLAFDSSGCLQFQWAIINKKDGQLHLMEKEKHSVCGRGTWLCAVAPWNTSRVFVEDAPICLERPDMVAGRTDVLVKTKKTRLDAIRKWLKKDPTMKLSTLMPVSQVTVPSKADSRPRNTPTKTDKEQAKRSLLSIKYNSPNSTKQADKNTKLTGLSVKIASGDKVKTPLEKLSIEEAKPSEGMALIKGKGQTLVAKTSSQTEITDTVDGCRTKGSILGYLSDTLVSFQKWEFPESGFSDLVKNAVVDFGFFNKSDNGDKMVGNSIISTCCSKADINDDSGFDSCSISQLTQTLDDSLTDAYKHDKKDTKELSTDIMISEYKDIDWKSEIQGGYFSCAMLTDIELNKHISSVVDISANSIVKNEKNCFSNSSNDAIDLENGFDEQYLDLVSKKVSEEDDFVDEIAWYKNNRIHHEFEGTSFNVEFSDVNISDNEGVTQGGEEEDNENVVFDSMIDFETPDKYEIKKRMMARKLEEEWGKSQQEPSRYSSKDSLLHNLDFSSSLSVQSLDSCHPASLGEWLCPQEAHHNDVVQYSKSELESMIVPTFQSVDRRSVARLMEEKWGRESKEVQNKN